MARKRRLDDFVVAARIKFSDTKRLATKVSTISLKGGNEFGERAGTRTRDHLIKSQVLYHLSYAPL